MSKSEVKLFLQIEKQGYRYDVSATYKKEKCSKPQKFERTLYLDMLGSSDNLKVKEYRCYGHTLNSYFQNNIKSINEGNFQDRSDPGINFRSDVDDLKDVDVKLKVSICKVKINIYDKNDTILSNLTYTSEEYLQNRNLYVYFYNPNDRETDTLPLLFQYKDAFYAPESRENYFKKWKEVTELNKIVNKQVNVYLTNESQESIREKELKAERIRNKLDKIFKMLNEVNLLKRSDYGIPYCSKEFLNTKYFNTKRFEVKVSKNNTYQKVTHTSVNKYLIGSIKGVENCNFDDHVDKMIKKDVVNEVVAYFHGNEKRPELILLNEKVGYGWSSTYGYYEKRDKTYIYNHLKYGINIEFTGGSQFYDEESPVIDILKKMKNENMIDDHPQRQIDTYTEECQNEYEEDVEDGQCPTPVRDIYTDSLTSNIRSKRTVQPETDDNQHVDQGTEDNGLVLRQDKGGNRLQTEVLHTQTEHSPSHGKEKVPPGSNIQGNRTYQSTGSIGQDLLTKAESVNIGGNQDSLRDNDERSGQKGEAEETVISLPEIPCTGEGEETTYYVNTGMKSFDNFMNGAIDYAKNNPGVVSTAGAGSLLSCAGGGYGVYKLLLRFR